MGAPTTARPTAGSVGATISATIAMASVGSSVAVSEQLVDYPVLSAQAFRYAIGSLALAAWFRVQGIALPRPRTNELGRLVLLAATGLAGFNVCVLLALRTTEPAAVGVVVGCVPLVLAVVEPLRRGLRPARRTVIAALVVVVGAAVVQGGGRSTTAGILLALGALAAEAAFTLLAVPLLPRLRPSGVSLLSCAAAAVLLAVLAPIFDGSAAFTAPSADEFTAIAYLALVVTAFAFVLWYHGVQHLGADRAGLLAGLVPVSALLTSLVLGSAEGLATGGAGTAIVVVGLTIGLAPTRQTRQTPQIGVESHENKVEGPCS
ncbi:MAG: DMT family transporter [Acidimicrobiales bacterium]